MAKKKTTEEQVIVQEKAPVKDKYVLAVKLGDSLPVGSVITEETYLDLKGAGFTDEMLFGKQ